MMKKLNINKHKEITTKNEIDNDVSNKRDFFGRSPLWDIIRTIKNETRCTNLF